MVSSSELDAHKERTGKGSKTWLAWLGPAQQGQKKGGGRQGRKDRGECRKVAVVAVVVKGFQLCGSIENTSGGLPYKWVTDDGIHC